MTQPDRHTEWSASPLQRLRLIWLSMLRGILHWWVRAKALPDPIASAELDSNAPSCYVLDTYALSSVLILDRSCEKLNLPRPLMPIKGLEHSQQRSYAALRRLTGLFIRRPSARRSSEVLKKLVERAYEDPDFDLQLIPVSVMVGRAPDKEESLAKVLFAEGWDVGGRLKRLLGTLINGRATFVQFSKPVSLRELADENIGTARTLRKASRIFRTHFKRVREAAIGPDLSHRRTLISQIINTPRVQEAIKAKAKRENISEEKARRAAQKHAREIAANYSYMFVRLMSFLLTWFWNKIYDGVSLNHFRDFQHIAPGNEVIYVPCHRSHIDYVLLSYLLYHNGFVPPHVAAGVNLNLPVVGSWLRKGGAFFLRRSFRSNLLYAAVFDEYVSAIMAKGVAVEYFIEGTRSRTGRLLQPKAGMLAMTVRGYLRAPHRPVVFQPIYIGYEKLAEGNAYTSELSGKSKKSESLGDLLNIFKVLRREYGKAHVNFGTPVYLDRLLDQYGSGWRETNFETNDRPQWLPPLIDDLSQRIMSEINAAADVNPINLLALAMLATPKHAMAEADLVQQIALYKRILEAVPLGRRVTATEMDGDAIIDYGIGLGIIERHPHKLGDIIQVLEDQAVLITYFRNNVAHLFALAAFIACCFLNKRRFGRQRLKRLFQAVYPFLKSELFLPWPPNSVLPILEQNIAALLQLGLLTEERGGAMLVRAEGGSDEAIQLRMLGHSLLQTFQRYYITIAVLVKNGSGSLSRAELEQLCMLTGQRISLLSEFNAPEFYDKNLFKHFIAQLRTSGVLRRDEDGKLQFDQTLEQIAEDAKLILSKEIRHAIIQIAPALLEDEVKPS